MAVVGDCDVQIGVCAYCHVCVVCTCVLGDVRQCFGDHEVGGCFDVWCRVGFVDVELDW